jgi:hypothetical protein
VESFHTTFDPTIDGFAFANRFSWSEEEREVVHDVFADALVTDDDAPAQAPVPLIDPLLTADGPGPLPPAVSGVLLLEGAQDLAGDFADAVLRDGGGSFGLCGGMAAAALDYRLVNWVIPRGNGPDDQPSRDTPSGRVLRDYLWGRLVAAIEPNAPTLLQCLVALKLPGAGGAEWLRDRTREQWQHLTSAMPVTGDPVPLAVVGTNTSPLQHQQVLAIGFDDTGNDTGSLYLYDANLPDDVARIDFDLRGGRLTTTRDDPLTAMPGRGPLQGFFVEAYNAGRPPPTLAAALRAEPTCALAGAPIHFSCQVVNRGYHTSPEFLVAIHGDAGEIDLREAAAKALDENIDRAFDTTGAFTHPGSHSATATAVLVTSNGTEARRELAWMGVGATPCVTIRSNPPVVIEPGRDCASRAVPAGGRISCGVQRSSLGWVPVGVEPKYSWEAAGQTGTDETFVFTVPETPGQPFEVRCTVTAGACWSSGTETLTPLPPAEADRLIAACAFLKELRVEKLLPFFNRLDGRESRETPPVLVPMVDTMAAAARRFVHALEPRKREP